MKSTPDLLVRITLLTLFRNDQCQSKSVNNSSQNQPNITSTYITKYNNEERQNYYDDDTVGGGIPWGDLFGSQGNNPEVMLTIYI